MRFFEKQFLHIFNDITKKHREAIDFFDNMKIQEVIEALEESNRVNAHNRKAVYIEFSAYRLNCEYADDHLIVCTLQKDSLDAIKTYKFRKKDRYALLKHTLK